MKIVMFCDFYGESLLYQENLVADQYVKLGHSVTVVTSTFTSLFDFTADKYDAAAPSSVAHHRGIKIVRVPYRLNILNRVRSFESVGPLLEDEAPDLIFFHDINFNLIEAVRYVRQHPATRMILDYHADYTNSGKNWLSRRVLHGVLRKAMLNHARPHLQRIFPVTPASAAFLHDLYDVPYEEMELLPLGSDLDLVARVHAEGAGVKLRQEYKIGEEDFVIFTGGKFDPRKHTELLIQAFLNLESDRAWLVIAGDGGPGEAQYKQSLLYDAAASPRIRFTGWLDTRQMFEYLDMADIAAFPASQSVVWQHAIAMGKPMVIGDPRALKGGLQDFSHLNPYDNILFTDEPSLSVGWLQKALRLMMVDASLRARMAEGARRTAVEHLDWTKIIQRTLRYRTNES